MTGTRFGKNPEKQRVRSGHFAIGAWPPMLLHRAFRRGPLPLSESRTD
jgi:hypothetical protein